MHELSLRRKRDQSFFFSKKETKWKLAYAHYTQIFFPETKTQIALFIEIKRGRKKVTFHCKPEDKFLFLMTWVIIWRGGFDPLEESGGARNGRDRLRKGGKGETERRQGTSELNL